MIILQLANLFLVCRFIGAQLVVVSKLIVKHNARRKEELQTVTYYFHSITAFVILH